jgi:hypothetical protein
MKQNLEDSLMGTVSGENHEVIISKYAGATYFIVMKSNNITNFFPGFV